MQAAIGGLLAMAAAIGIGRFVYTPILPAMTEALGLGHAAAGLIASANFIGYLAGAILSAWPGLCGSRSQWLVGSLIISAMTTAGMGLARSLPAFVVLRGAGGIASAIVLVFATAVVLERLSETRRMALSAVHFAGVGVGIAVSAALVAMLVRTGQSWRSLWVASGALSLAATVAVAVLLRGVTDPRSQSSRDPGAAVDSRLRNLIVAYGLFGFGYVITATFLVVMVRTSSTLRAVEPAIWVLFGLAAVPSVALWAWVSARTGAARAFAVASVTEAGGILATVVWHTEAGVIVSAMLVGGTFMGLTALGLVQARSMAGADPRRVLAMMTGAFGLGQIIGPSFAGAVADWLGGFVVPSATAALALVSAAALVLWRRA